MVRQRAWAVSTTVATMLALGATAPIRAEAPVGAVFVKGGDMVELRRDPAQGWVQISRNPVTSRKPSRWDRFYFGPWEVGKPPAPMPPLKRGEVDFYPPKTDTIRFSLGRASTGKAWSLVIENGFSRWLRYKAELVGQEGDIKMQVCTVEPQSSGLELVPSPYDRILMSLHDFELINAPADGKRKCE